jgi:sulfur-oxidizing protein SoxX
MYQMVNFRDILPGGTKSVTVSALPFRRAALAQNQQEDRAMGKPVKHAALVALAIFAANLSMAPQIASAADAETVKAGKAIAFDRKKGNCLACHQMSDGASPGDIGPPLIAMKARFPDRAKLHAQVVDPRTTNPETRMPPFGAHGILSNSEVDKVVDFLLTL